MKVSRRRFLGLVGLTPAVPFLSKIPVADALPTPVDPATSAVKAYALRNESLLVTGGLCAPMSPIYAIPTTPIRDSIPAISATRGGVRFSKRGDRR